MVQPNQGTFSRRRGGGGGSGSSGEARSWRQQRFLLPALTACVSIGIFLSEMSWFNDCNTATLRGGGGEKVSQANKNDAAKSLNAYKQSRGLFDDISDLMWERMKLNTKSKSLYWNPNNPLDQINNREFWNSHNPRPNFICPHTVAMGKHNQDGVKYLCYPDQLVNDYDDTNNDLASGGGDASSPCLIYSFGCAGDFKFEDEVYNLHGRKCETHVFDPAKKWERKGDVENKNIHYHPWGLMSTYDRENKSKVWPAGRGGEYKTMSQIMKELGHEERVIDVFKIDCEGCVSKHSSYVSFLSCMFIL